MMALESKSRGPDEKGEIKNEIESNI